LNLISQRGWGSRIAIKMASIGEGDYQVVKKRALCCSRLSVFLFFQELRKIRPPARIKKLEENSGPDPLTQGKIQWY
jgi:hypothetical protein